MALPEAYPVPAMLLITRNHLYMPAFAETSNITSVFITNGNVLKADNTPFTDTEVPFGSAIDLVLSPAEGYKQNGVVIKHGYLNNPEFIHSNRQWRLDTIPENLFLDNKFTIPATFIDGDVEISADFKQLSGVQKLILDTNLVINTKKNILNVTALTPDYVTISDVTGRTYFFGYLSGVSTFKLHSGVYFVNRQKVLVP